MQNIGFYIFNMVVFFVFVTSQNTEIVIVSKFWLGMYKSVQWGGMKTNKLVFCKK